MSSALALQSMEKEENVPVWPFLFVPGTSTERRPKSALLGIGMGLQGNDMVGWAEICVCAAIVGVDYYILWWYTPERKLKVRESRNLRLRLTAAQ